jgi:hypothetical protein
MINLVDVLEAKSSFQNVLAHIMQVVLKVYFVKQINHFLMF